MEKNEIQKFFKLKTDRCCLKDCGARACWQPVFLIFADCDSQCGVPHFQEPGILISDAGYCDAHKQTLTLDTFLGDGLWDKLCGDFRGRGLREPRKDWTALSLHKIPDNLVQFNGPKLVPTNPEPQPPAA